ncbi:1-deoxy-D-xylulose-5-phosphate synthase [Fusibacter ferrireducens]|uniref:1-deoxy-D-xylulose-5-phosphate synthase n=1 Tax=Fusibacter ferrireducens TaxID=2785058 RepID=A0ABR9ZVN7_9FIRM|nr:1-deoxy-D-xylulose-5-phosphate synthase [Fusibacter ferrireducens]MBF4693679.1 1-deoxy-D-xylulose-5-phosphate synthase [Fusibacter ferrireducens]
MYKILDSIQNPDTLKQLSFEELVVLCHEMRAFLVENISKTGGHLSSNLGVVELTVALHYVFDSPTDKLLWDVGHQAYVHKVLTGRKEDFKSLRQFNGLSGFLKRKESEHDIFEAGHSSTSISAGIGFATARDLKEAHNEVISIIGDGALTGGMALEALNYLGHVKTNMKVVLNDNEMSISENVGGLAKALSRLRTTETYSKVKMDTKATLSKIPSIGDNMIDFIGKLKDSLKYFVVDGGLFFEEIGLTYIGPINGHDLKELIETFQMIKHVKGPVLVHVLTQKGKGYAFSEKDPNKYHGVGQFDPEKCIESKAKNDYSKVFGDKLIQLATENQNVVAITAAMADGTGLNEFASKFPNRIFDVAIAEQHAVTMAAGLAMEGIKPYVAIYSTFLQRAYDQIVHDVCIQKAPVVLCLDRAGLVGNDGETHHGIFDIGYLSHMPGMMILSPKDQFELEDMMQFALTYKEGPIAIRYPRGKAHQMGAGREHTQSKLTFHPEVLHEGDKVALVATGKMVQTALACADELGARVINVSQIKPLDIIRLESLLQNIDFVFTIEDHTISGGFGDQVISKLIEHHSDLMGKTKFYKLGIPDVFVPHGDTDMLMQDLGLDKEGIVKKVSEVING